MLGVTADSKKINLFQSSGYDALDACVSEELAQTVYEEFSSATWDQRHEQTRPDHYKHVFQFVDPELPGEDECYQASFMRSSALEGSATVSALINSCLVPILEQYVSSKIKRVDVRCIAMQRGGFMRAHVDDYAGAAGFIFYVNKRWCVDWGGLLAIRENEGLKVFCPKFNRLIVIGHKQSRLPHFVTQVTDYAREDRFAITGFCEV